MLVAYNIFGENGRKAEIINVYNKALFKIKCCTEQGGGFQHPYGNPKFCVHSQLYINMRLIIINIFWNFQSFSVCMSVMAFENEIKVSRCFG